MSFSKQTDKSMYDWIKAYHQDGPDATNDQADKIRRLEADLRRVTEERDILRSAVLVKKATVYFTREAK